VKKLLVLALLAAVGYLAYSYVATGENPLTGLKDSLVGPPGRDAEGRELIPCSRCLASGLITCTAHRCKQGSVPCTGPCLKLSDRGWQQMPGEDPNKLFMVYRVAGGTRGISQAHVGEVFEVRLGKFYALGACQVCGGRTTLTCKSCEGTGKVTCTVCGGRKTVAKAAPVAPSTP
jgi:hypothetical protein